jgi:hypothetical protein
MAQVSEFAEYPPFDMPTDFSVEAKDRPDFVVGDTTYISTPAFRALFYERGYEDGWQFDDTRYDKVMHPDNEAAYEMGYLDGVGDSLGDLEPLVANG